MKRAVLICAVASFTGLAANRSARDGVYTGAQAARGLTVYREECAKCHGETLGGGETAPSLVGKEFFDAWKGRTVGDLQEIVTKTMPTDDPGNLSRRQYADVVAFLLKSNEFPAGDKELDTVAASNKDISIDVKK
jgi:cytochrome c